AVLALERRHAPGTEPRLRRVDCTHRNVALLAQDHQALLRNDLSEVGAADVVAYLRDRRRELRLVRADSRLRTVDASAPLAAELERHRQPVGFLRRFL